MTIRTTIECDGRGCVAELDVDECDTPRIAMKYEEWQEDPERGGFHYCPACWKKIQAEQGQETTP